MEPKSEFRKHHGKKKTFSKPNKLFRSKNASVKLYRRKQVIRDIEAEEITSLHEQYEKMDVNNFKKFADLPLTKKSQRGLKDAGYVEPTEIQRESLCFALKGCDILGAAKTGSGKTLAFIIPILEHLYVQRWSKYEGTGAVIITPTRELSYQIYEVLLKVGGYHDFSAGLIIGGKDLKFEQKRMDKCNIIVCTPGRLLQHMDQNPLFSCNNLQILVLDEADRILDMGFQKTLNAIIENLPSERQTLLFSATQTKSVKDLVRLSLKNPVYVSVHEHAKHSTPEMLQQHYVICELHEKMEMLWSFLKTHKKQKVLVFMSTCKQVKYTYDLFCRLRPGMSVMALYGTLHQQRRMAIYDDFCQKNHAVLFATDIAGRGLDFPAVNWVIQLDCPEDVNTYIHRAGRTARYQDGGNSLLVLLPSEKVMLSHLEARNIPINKISINPNRLVSIQKKIEAQCARDVELKDSAQRAFKLYLKCVFLMKDKEVFKVKDLDVAAYARSLGLAVVPKLRYIEKHSKPKVAISNKEEMNAKSSDSNDSEDDFLTVKRKITYPEVAPKPVSSKKELIKFSSDEEKSTDKQIKSTEEQMKSSNKPKLLTKPAVVKKLLKKKFKLNTRTVFDEDGEAFEELPTKQKVQILADSADKIFSLELAKKIMTEEDKIDKELYRKRIKAKHKEERLKEKERRKKKKQDEEQDVQLKDNSSSSEGEDISAMIDALPDPDEMGKDEDDSFATTNKTLDYHSTKKRVKISTEENDYDHINSLNDDEELALQYLQNDVNKLF